MKKSRLRYSALIAVAFCIVAVSGLFFLWSMFPFSNGRFPLNERWSRHLGGKISDISVSQEGILLANTIDSIVALEVKDGDILWSEQVHPPLQPFPISIENSTLYAVDNKSIRAFELETGKPLWHQPLLSSHAHILDTSEKYLIVNFLSDSISTYDAQTGSRLWNLPSRRGYVQAFIDENRIYVLGDDIKEVNAETGEILWSESLDIKDEGWYEDGIIYFIGGDPYDINQTYVVAFDVVARKELWRTKLLTQGVNKFLLYRDNLFVLDQENIYALRKLGGGLNWKTGVASPTNPVIVDNKIWVIEGFTRLIRGLDIYSGRIVGSAYISWPRLFLSNSQDLVSYESMLLFSQDSKIFAYGD